VVAADSEVNSGQKIVYGDTTFDIYNYGVAHTDTDIMIAVNRNEVLFTGDNLFNGRLGRSLEGNVKGIIDSCETVVAEVQPVHIVPGHGRSGGMDMFNYALDAVRILYTTVQQEYENGVSDYEMKPVVEAAMLEYSDWEEFDNLLGKIINQAYLEIEADSF
jgi:glyoxylase-like metal-dependent hydrolase (beta-lactamase superfamily II)